jgi:hypothetical protein
MSNMSYCQFENTLRDLAQCTNTVEQFMDANFTLSETVAGEKFEKDLSSHSERDAFNSLVGQCREFLQAYADLRGVAIDSLEDAR